MPFFRASSVKLKQLVEPLAKAYARI